VIAKHKYRGFADTTGSLAARFVAATAIMAAATLGKS
jgi:hypothetical protein